MFLSAFVPISHCTLAGSLYYLVPLSLAEKWKSSISSVMFGLWSTVPYSSFSFKCTPHTLLHGSSLYIYLCDSFTNVCLPDRIADSKIAETVSFILLYSQILIKFLAQNKYSIYIGWMVWIKYKPTTLFFCSPEPTNSKTSSNLLQWHEEIAYCLSTKSLHFIYFYSYLYLTILFWFSPN